MIVLRKNVTLLREGYEGRRGRRQPVAPAVPQGLSVKAGVDVVSHPLLLLLRVATEAGANAAS
jgi:hypothetical protein